METLLEILEETTWWVYLIFLYLLVIGCNAARRRTMSLKKIFVLPAVLLLWFFFEFYEWWPGTWTALFYWLLSLAAGIGLGWFTVHKWKIYVDRQRKIIILPGTWSTLALAMLFFFIRYGFALYYRTHGDISHTALLVDLIVSGILNGAFIGRTFTFWRRYERPL